MYKLSHERAVGYSSAIEGLIAKVNSRTGLWARCLTSLLLDPERSLKSLLSKTKRNVRLATNYFFIVFVTFITKNWFYSVYRREYQSNFKLIARPVSVAIVGIHFPEMSRRGRWPTSVIWTIFNKHKASPHEYRPLNWCFLSLFNTFSMISGFVMNISNISYRSSRKIENFFTSLPDCRFIGI